MRQKMGGSWKNCYNILRRYNNSYIDHIIQTTALNIASILILTSRESLKKLSLLSLLLSGVDRQQSPVE